MLIVDNELRQKTNIFQEAKGASTQMAKKELKKQNIFYYFKIYNIFVF